VIEDIYMAYSANAATIPIELYTVDGNENKIE
jgi:hypothetical protein